MENFILSESKMSMNSIKIIVAWTEMKLEKQNLTGVCWSSGNHDDDGGDKNVTNVHIKQRKKKELNAFFIFWYISVT